MPTVARTIGGPGAGKTTRALQLMEMVLEKLVQDPLRIGFVSFTRAARREASSRAADKFDVKASALEKTGWFRTLHSVCHKQLGIQKGELLIGDSDDQEWIKNALNDDRAMIGTTNIDDDGMVFSHGQSDASKALAMWDVARNLQVPLETVWLRSRCLSERIPDQGVCDGVVWLYERAKAKDGRLDFSDLLMRFAGRRWTDDDRQPFTNCEPEGQVPLVPVWLADEQQDTSRLASLVFRRLIQPSTWVYLFGDDWQEIYAWAGADSSIFSNWEVSKEEVLPVSYRCPSKILAFGDRIMQQGGYPVRSFRAERDGGEIRYDDLEFTLGKLKPGEDTLVLARTNAIAKRCSEILNESAIPWKPTKGGGGFSAPAVVVGVTALAELRSGNTITGEAAWRMMSLFPSKAGGTELLKRGTKSWWEDENNRHSVKEVTLQNLEETGCTESLKQLIGSGGYKTLLQVNAERMAKAAEEFGADCIKNPTIRVGTMHSAKGAQAEHVVAVNCMSRAVRDSCETDLGMDQERKLWFVTATRAKERLTIACDDHLGEEWSGI